MGHSNLTIGIDFKENPTENYEKNQDPTILSSIEQIVPKVMMIILTFKTNTFTTTVQIKMRNVVNILNLHFVGYPKKKKRKKKEEITDYKIH